MNSIIMELPTSSYRFTKNVRSTTSIFFIPIITLLRNAAMNSLKYKKELNLMRKSKILTLPIFEDKIENF